MNLRRCLLPSTALVLCGSTCGKSRGDSGLLTGAAGSRKEIRRIRVKVEELEHGVRARIG